MRRLYSPKPGDLLENLDTGDVIAFGGKCLFSRAIQLKTMSPVSHVAIVIKRGSQAYCVEACGDGVIESPFKQAIKYDGHVWWLPLSSDARRIADASRIVEFSESLIGRPYDMKQAIKSAIDLFDIPSKSPDDVMSTLNNVDLSKLFCSELVASVLEAGYVISDINPSELTPKDVVALRIYAGAFALSPDAPLLKVGRG